MRPRLLDLFAIHVCQAFVVTLGRAAAEKRREGDGAVRQVPIGSQLGPSCCRRRHHTAVGVRDVRASWVVAPLQDQAAHTHGNGPNIHARPVRLLPGDNGPASIPAPFGMGEEVGSTDAEGHGDTPHRRRQDEQLSRESGLPVAPPTCATACGVGRGPSEGLPLLPGPTNEKAAAVWPPRDSRRSPTAPILRHWLPCRAQTRQASWLERQP